MARTVVGAKKSGGDVFLGDDTGYQIMPVSNARRPGITDLSQRCALPWRSVPVCEGFAVRRHRDYQREGQCHDTQ